MTVRRARQRGSLWFIPWKRLADDGNASSRSRRLQFRELVGWWLSNEAMRPIHPVKALFGMRARETVEDLAAVHTYTTELSAGAISGVERDGQASL